MSVSRKIYITGVSGTGKSTLARELNKRGVMAIDIDAVPGLCHWRNKETHERADHQHGTGRDWLAAHDWVFDPEMLQRLLTQADTVVVLGFTRNQEEYFNLFDSIFLLRCPPEVFIHRLDTRTENQFAKEKSEQEHILAWYKNFEARMIKAGAIPIDTDRPITEVAEVILTELDKKEWENELIDMESDNKRNR
ncbi:MAG: AAA family ATPase [Candidatus Uhrbacteria bacterium]|nr:AAA family ATPase [Candidatus Uhrbacteria bacterium]